MRGESRFDRKQLIVCGPGKVLHDLEQVQILVVRCRKPDCKDQGLIRTAGVFLDKLSRDLPMSSTGHPSGRLDHFVNRSLNGFLDWQFEADVTHGRTVGQIFSVG